MRRLTAIFIAATAIVTVPAASADSTAPTCGTVVDAPLAQDDIRPPVRLAGASRTATAANVAASGWPDGADTVLLATSQTFPDALAAGAYAARQDAPILLTGRNRLDQDAADALAALAPDTVVLLGAGGALSDFIAFDVERILPSAAIERIAGNSRYETARKLAEAAGTPEPVTYQSETFTYAIVATANSFPDALAAGSHAASPARVPVVLTEPNGLHPSAAAALTALDVDRVVVAGGQAAVSERVVDELNARGYDVVRDAGADRYDTAKLLTERARTWGWSGHPDGPTTTVLATAGNFPDALAATPYAARTGAVIALTPTEGLSQHTADALFARWSHLVTIGGAAAVSDAATGQATLATGGPTGRAAHQGGEALAAAIAATPPSGPAPHDQIMLTMWHAGDLPGWIALSPGGRLWSNIVWNSQLSTPLKYTSIIHEALHELQDPAYTGNYLGMDGPIPYVTCLLDSPWSGHRATPDDNGFGDNSPFRSTIRQQAIARTSRLPDNVADLVTGLFVPTYLDDDSSGNQPYYSLLKEVNAYTEEVNAGASMRAAGVPVTANVPGLASLVGFTGTYLAEHEDDGTWQTLRDYGLDQLTVQAYLAAGVAWTGHPDVEPLWDYAWDDDLHRTVERFVGRDLPRPDR